VGDTASRLLKLLSLLQRPRDWPGRELAERLEVTPRTVRRDIQRLRDLGYPVHATRGSTGGYRLVAGTAMPPLLLDDDEAVAVAVGLRTAANHAVEGIDEVAARALAKLERVLPSRLRYRVGSLSSATLPLLAWHRPTVASADLTLLAAAIGNHEEVRFAYRAHDGSESRRRAQPHRLVSDGPRWYLVAYDLDRDDWRIFRVDRVRDPRATGARFTPWDLPAEDAAAYVAERFAGFAPTYRAIVTLHASAEEVAGRLRESSGRSSRSTRIAVGFTATRTRSSGWRSDSS
jgi:predicted DNA-binding transcriptional regulator YafY